MHVYALTHTFCTLTYICFAVHVGQGSNVLWAILFTLLGSHTTTTADTVQTTEIGEGSKAISSMTESGARAAQLCPNATSPRRSTNSGRKKETDRQPCQQQLHHPGCPQALPQQQSRHCWGSHPPFPNAHMSGVRRTVAAPPTPWHTISRTDNSHNGFTAHSSWIPLATAVWYPHKQRWQAEAEQACDKPHLKRC